MTTGTSTGRRKLGRVGLVVVVAMVVVVATGTGIALAAAGDGDGGRGPAAGLPPATAQVTRQTLVDARTEDGELGHGAPTSVTGRLGGTITALPATGAVVERGQALYRVDDTPVVVLHGPLPAYRTLAPGDEGADVAQFEQNLSELGYAGFTVDDTYSTATATAVREWQEDLGLPETGRVEHGRVVYTAGPVRVDSLAADVGDQVQPGGAVLEHTGLSQVVTVELDVDDQRLARPDAPAGITLPDGGTVPGRVVAAETVVVPAEGMEPASTVVEVTVAADDPAALAALGSASVEVEFTAAQRADVLTVPVAALLALAEGGYGVELVEGATSRIVAVDTGLFADGRVEVGADGLAEGMTVGMPS